MLLALIEKGLDRQDAYELVQSHAKRAWADEGDFRASLSADPRVQQLLTPDEIAALFDPSTTCARSTRRLRAWA